MPQQSVKQQSEPRSGKPIILQSPHSLQSLPQSELQSLTAQSLGVAGAGLVVPEPDDPLPLPLLELGLLVVETFSVESKLPLTICVEPSAV